VHETISQHTAAEAVRGRPPATASAWRDFAACLTADPETFFPDPARIDLVQAAKAVCAACPVTSHCLNFAFLVGADAGIFGGTTPGGAHDHAAQKVGRRMTYLTPADTRTVLAALGDAAAYRTGRATGYCIHCATSPADLCPEHADELDQADAYKALDKRLGDDHR
jgi:WhiB family redox-sensing transcriptional regulator